jgi:regulator of sigma E protease
MSIFIFLAVLAVLIISHELGHFAVAKWSGVKVEEFGLGFPPRLFGWRWGETLYSLNILPFGGFVKIFGEDGADNALASGTEAGRLLGHKSGWIQAAVLAAGVTCNLLLAVGLFSIDLSLGLPTAASEAPAGAGPVKLLVTDVLPGSPAARAGLVRGDEIVSLTAGADKATVTPTGIQNLIAKHSAEPLKLTFQRAPWSKNPPTPQLANLQAEESELAGHPAIGIAMEEVVRWQLPLWRAVPKAVEMVVRLTIATALGLFNLIIQAFQGAPVWQQVTGPVGLVGLVGDASTLGASYLLSLIAFISINLAVINLIPFPALDGGRLLFLAIEKLRGRPISAKVANTLNLAGFALLLLFMAVVTYGDIVRLIKT